MYFSEKKRKEIGKRIKRERTLLNLSQVNLAEKLYIGSDENNTRQTIWNWETGRTMPSIDRFIELCEIFNCELDYLLCKHDCKTREASDIHNSLGLSENAITILKQINSSPYKDTINSLSQLIEHPQFLELLCDIHTHNNEFNQKHYYAKHEQITNLATILECSFDKATEYINSSSKSLITSKFIHIIESLSFTEHRKKNSKRVSKPIF